MNEETTQLSSQESGTDDEPETHQQHGRMIKVGFFRKTVQQGRQFDADLFGDDNGVSTSYEDLKYRGGRTIPHLRYVNLYISGDTEWTEANVTRVDRSLSAAMQDRNLNNVLLQYFNNQQITATALPSHPLVGYTPSKVTRGDIQNYAAYLHQRGYLRSYDLKNTVFNFLLPPGTLLATDSQAANSQRESSDTYSQSIDSVSRSTASNLDDADSLSGLAGYHGSVVIANGGRIYFAVATYSEQLPNGGSNGIPVFEEPWKNVVATLYHQLIEVRTDPDVEDALRDPLNPNARRSLGWVTDSGLEIGDLPLQNNLPLTDIIKEVPLADGSGMVPVQLPHSNAVRGPEGPISQPHSL